MNTAHNQMTQNKSKITNSVSPVTYEHVSSTVTCARHDDVWACGGTEQWLHSFLPPTLQAACGQLHVAAVLTWYPLSRRRGVHQSRPRRTAENKNQVPLPKSETIIHGRAARRLWSSQRLFIRL
jgi:hypothetical protein